MQQATPAPMSTPAPMDENSSHGGSHGLFADPRHKPEFFAAGDYVFTPNSKNEFNLYGANASNTFAGRAGLTFPFGDYAMMAEGTYQQYQYFHTGGPVATIGGGSTDVPTFYAHNGQYDGRLGVGLSVAHLYLVGSYAQRLNNYGYPNLQGYGFGLEKLPSFNHRVVSFYGSFLYYPSFESGNYLQYGMYKYQAGLEFHAPIEPLFIDIGYMGDYAYAKTNAPTGFQDSGLYAGLGLKL